MTFRRLLLVLLFLLCALGSLAWAWASLRKPLVETGLQAAKSGAVLDAQTRKPVPGAYVVVRWLEQSADRLTGNLQGQCLYRSIVRTDDQGRYSIAAAHFAVAEQSAFATHRYFWDTHAYAPGYEDVEVGRTAHPAVATSSVLPALQELEPTLLTADRSAPEQRVRALADSLSRFSCEPYAKELGSVAEQIYAEAYTAACLHEPNSAANLLRHLRATTPSLQPCEQFRAANNSR